MAQKGKILFKDEATKKFWEYNSKLYSRKSYGKDVIKFAYKWASCAEKCILKGRQIEDSIAYAAIYCGVHMISVSIYINVVLLLVNTWKYGEGLRKYHNKKYGYEGDGIANPGILVFERK